MKKLIIPFFTLFFIAFSCKENDVNEIKETIASAQDNAIVETQFAGIFEVTDDVASTDGKIKKTGGTILPSGALIVYRDSSYTDGDGIDFYIDFGPKGTTAPFGLLCLDGKYRAGILNITVSRPYSEIGTIVMVNISESDSFFSGNGTEMYWLSGTKKITRSSENMLEVIVTNGSLTDGTGKIIKWISTKNIKRTLDIGPGIWGDHFEFTGSASGVNHNGEDFTVTIDTPLLKKVIIGCHKTFVRGILTLKNTVSGNTIVVNYDPYENGACDVFAEATINGRKTIFEVK